MTFSGGAAPDTDRDPDRRRQLVATARLLADETGSAAFTVARLTSRAGVSLKAFYACFRSKDDLLLALLAEDSRIGADVLAGRIGSRTGRAGLRAYVFELFDMLTLPGAIGYAGVLVRERRRLIERRNWSAWPGENPPISMATSSTWSWYRTMPSVSFNNSSRSG